MKKLFFILLMSFMTLTSNAQFYNYDVNDDGAINVTDISCLVNKILGELNPGEEVDVSPLKLSTRKLNLITGNSEVVEIVSGSGHYTVYSSNEAVTTAALTETSITVTAVGVGDTFITVTDTKSGQSSTIKIVVDGEATSYLTCPDDNHPHIIDLGLPSGTKWACCNVDTDHPENQSPTNYGGYYAWGETETKTTYYWDTYIHCDGSYDTCHDLGSIIAGTQYDVAHMKWGGSWMMPSKEQLDELHNNCTYEWTTVNGVKGGKFTGKKGGNIFLPAAGYRYESDLYYAGSDGYYWSSTQYPSNADYAYYLNFYSGYTGWSYYYRYIGRSVRPVSRN